MAEPISIIASLRKEIAERQQQISDIQSQCSHPDPALNKVYGGSTGNWSPSDDCYWTDYHCQLCDKRWRDVRRA